MIGRTTFGACSELVDQSESRIFIRRIISKLTVPGENEVEVFGKVALSDDDTLWGYTGRYIKVNTCLLILNHVIEDAQ